MARVRWQYPCLFYVIAFAISIPFNTGIIYKWLHWHVTVMPWRLWLFAPAALGPLVAAILCYRLDRATPRCMVLFGNDPMGSKLTALIPLVIFPIAGYADGGTRGLLYTSAAVGVALLYALGEESGWRGYLQDVLSPLSARQRYLLIGLFWWAWHGRFANAFEWTVFLLIVIASAFVLGHVAETTRSLLVVASMHSVIMLLTMNGSMTPAFGVAGAAIVVSWILVGKLRPVKTQP